MEPATMASVLRFCRAAMDPAVRLAPDRERIAHRLLARLSQVLDLSPHLEMLAAKAQSQPLDRDDLERLRTLIETAAGSDPTLGKDLDNLVSLARADFDSSTQISSTGLDIRIAPDPADDIIGSPPPNPA